MTPKRIAAAGRLAGLAPGMVLAPPVPALLIDFNIGAGFDTRPEAVAALQRGAAQWSNRIADPVTPAPQPGIGH